MDDLTTDAELDLPAKVAKAIVDNIDSVKSKTTKPAELAAKGIVAAIAMLALIPALVAVLLIGVVRAMSKLPWELGYSYLILGFLLLVPGLFLLNKAHNYPTPSCAKLEKIYASAA